MKFGILYEYDKDLKWLLKKYRTLENDIDSVKNVLTIRPNASPPFSFQIEGLGISTCVIKVKKIASDSFKGRGINSGFRLVYAYFHEEQRIVFVELYHKNEKDNEDRVRIKNSFE
jgi:mRNA-degrading endonuclease RelE of RelBE toxin-antitoxin system